MRRATACGRTHQGLPALEDRATYRETCRREGTGQGEPAKRSVVEADRGNAADERAQGESGGGARACFARASWNDQGGLEGTHADISAPIRGGRVA